MMKVWEISIYQSLKAVTSVCGLCSECDDVTHNNTRMRNDVLLKQSSTYAAIFLLKTFLDHLLLDTITNLYKYVVFLKTTYAAHIRTY